MQFRITQRGTKRFSVEYREFFFWHSIMENIQGYQFPVSKCSEEEIYGVIEKFCQSQKKKLQDKKDYPKIIKEFTVDC